MGCGKSTGHAEPNCGFYWEGLGVILCDDCKVKKKTDRITELEARVKELEEDKDGAYQERDKLVCALSKMFPSYLMRHPDTDAEWEDDWRWIVMVQLPAGQASWHIHDSERLWFEHLDLGGREWDGHSTAEKYLRLDSIDAARAAEGADS